MNDENLLIPEIGIIKEIIKETDNEKRFRIAFENGRSLGFRPGQFVILSILGVGKRRFPSRPIRMMRNASKSASAMSVLFQEACTGKCPVTELA